MAVDALAPQWRLAMVGATSERQELPFHAEADGIVVEGRLTFDPVDQMLRMEGVYRTRQALDPRAKLSYQLYSDEGKVLLADGQRFNWRASADGGVESDFLIKDLLTTQSKLRPVARVQFNYVVEHEFWYRDRYPELFIPEIAVGGVVRVAQFSVRWAWIPPVLPAQTEGVLPAWVGAEFAGKAPPYSAALDVLAANGPTRIEAPRQPLPPALILGGRALVFYGFGEATGRSIRVRPGFVWENVQWFDLYRGNPYYRVLLIGPLEYAVGFTLGLLGLLWGWTGLRGVRPPKLRRAGYCLWGALALALVATTAVSLYLVLVVGLALIWWVQRRVVAPGPRVYWTTWAFLVMLEFYWGHVNAGGRGLWIGTLLSASLAAVLLLPLRSLKRPNWAAWVGTGFSLIATLAATAMALYFAFFCDYPGLRDLLYAGQVGEVGDSVATLIDQRHLVPWWLWACSVVGLWRK
jgi:hypothetical protein